MMRLRDDVRPAVGGAVAAALSAEADAWAAARRDPIANDEEPRRATLDFINRSPGKYRMLLDRKTRCNQHPTFWNGVMVFARV